jgi:RHS repeat-associated protein
VTSTANKFVADAIRWVHVPNPVVTQTVTTQFIHFDQLGTPRQVTDANQVVVWRWDSRPFGNSVPNEDPDGNTKTFVLNLRFPGQYFDAESALNYNYFRDYDPSTGRYLESDPLLRPFYPIGEDLYVQAQSFRTPGFDAHPYVYTANTPLIASDRKGLGYLDCLSCLKRLDEFGAASKKCKEEWGDCGEDIDAQLEFYGKYEPRIGMGHSGSMLECVLQTLGNEKVAKISSKCSGCSISAPRR